MAEEKDTDSAPDDGVTESDAVTPSPRHGIGPGTADEQDSPEELDASDSTDTDSDGDDPEVPEELRAADSPATADDADDSEDSDDDRELVGVGATAKSGSRSSGQVAKPAGRTKKDKPTPKQRAEADKPKRTTPLEFVRGAISELKKVVYPTGSQLANYFVVVLVFVLLVIAIVTALDYGFGWAMLKVFS